MSRILSRVFSISLLLMMVACVSRVATREDIEWAYQAGDRAYLEGVIEGSIPAGEPELRQLAEQLDRDLELQELELSIERAREDADLAHLEAVRDGWFDDWITPELKQRAGLYLAELERKALEDSIERAFSSGDAAFLESIAAVRTPAERASRGLTPAMVQRSAAYLDVLRDTPGIIARLRGSPLDPRVRGLGVFQQGVFREPETGLEPLVEALLNGVHNPFERVKLIHDWIADNIAYDTAGYFSGRLGETSWAAVLRTRKSVCEGYAGLFSEMCRIAGIEERAISGFAKGYGYDSTGAVSDGPDHAWNAVRIRDAWYLVDVTWNSGSVGASRAFRKEYSTDYLFLEPEAFIYTHLPERDSDQFLERPVTRAEYEAMPWLKGSFFKYGLKLLSTGIGRQVGADSAFDLELACPPDVTLDGHLLDARNQPVKNTAFASRDGRIVRLAFAAPEPGAWKAVVFARFNRPPQGPLEGVFTFRLRTARGAASDPPFPLLYAAYDSLNCQLYGPLDGALPRGGGQEFRIRVPGASGVFLDEGERMIPFVHRGDGLFTLSRTVPAVAEVRVYARLPGQRNYSGLVNYRVR